MAMPVIPGFTTIIESHHYLGAHIAKIGNMHFNEGLHDAIYTHRIAEALRNGKGAFLLHENLTLSSPDIQYCL